MAVSAITAALDAAQQRAVLCWLATVDEQGQPNVSPKEVFAAIGADRLAIAHIASPRSVANIARNPRVCVSFVDIFVQKGWKLLGRAEILRAGEPGYDVAAAALESLAGPKFTLHAVIVVHVETALGILAPSYRVGGDTPEQERRQVREARRRYQSLLRMHTGPGATQPACANVHRPAP